MPLSEAFEATRAVRLAMLLLIVGPCLLLDALKIRATPRYLVYPPPATGAPTKVQLIFGLGIPMEVEVSTIVGYVMKCNYNLPYNSSSLSEFDVRQQRSTTADAKPAGRYEIYKLLETLVDWRSQSGKACLLRAICEAATSPLSSADGLLSELLHIFLTPSSTGEPLTQVDDQEYLAAEFLGRSPEANCGRVFTECDRDLLDYISKRY